MLAVLVVGWMLRPRRVVVDGLSMRPALEPGDRLVVGPGRARVGRIVVVDLGGGRPLAVKRVAARVRGAVWVVGDDLAHSTDSRSLGWIARGRIHGVVWWRYGPSDRRGRVAPAPSSDSTAGLPTIPSTIT
ncbi:S26 family signal peptidase [Acidimicrobium ferrooxidans]|nr:S26 family signal peptidase [Acidimicrobium ferrooxidans]